MSEKALQSKIKKFLNYSFKNKELLKEALTHDSYQKGDKNFERLEFIGDSCLSLVISNELFSKTNWTEGEMSKARSFLTRKETLAELLKPFSLEEYFVLGQGMMNMSLPDTIYADFFESLLGAVFKDSNYEQFYSVILHIYKNKLEEVLNDKALVENPKSLLQEKLMKAKKPIPKYTILNKKGASHNPEYTIQISFDAIQLEAKGNSIKEAEMSAALKALNYLSCNE